MENPDWYDFAMLTFILFTGCQIQQNISQLNFYYPKTHLYEHTTSTLTNYFKNTSFYQASLVYPHSIGFLRKTEVCTVI